MHFLGGPLECRNVGITIVRCEPGWRSEPHDHREDGHEEVYVLIEGEATVVVDDEEVEMGLGDAIWISPESTRQITNSDEESVFVLVSAPVSLEMDSSLRWVTDAFLG
ncbi:cupin domain-containing protein [Natronorubrum sp. A-ect3]|uniref:cupin domain-containing protein n=1 Tax=Natronorubrum sp. A-ect3 TaxID=3242698 RepID=UPI00359DBEC3